MYPALAVAEALVSGDPQVGLYFVGSGGLERDIVQQAAVPLAAYDDVRAGPVAGVSWPRRLASVASYAVGTLQALNLMRRYRPQVLLLTGGWCGLPVAFAARILRIPILIFLPDIEPGATIRLLQRVATKVALSVAESEKYFPHAQTVVTGYPLRQGLMQASRTGGLRHFGLDDRRKTLLVFGGSRGARSINRALLEILPELLADGVQVIHVTGTLDWPEVEARRSELNGGYHAYAYLHHDMGMAQAAADLVVSRAGASTLAESPYFGLASILVPYPHAWRYQKINADYLAERGAAVRLDDDKLPEQLLPTIRSLLNDASRLARMRANAQALACADGARRIAEELVQLAEKGSA